MNKRVEKSVFKGEQEETEEAKTVKISSLSKTEWKVNKKIS